MTAGGALAWCGLRVYARTLKLRSDLVRYGRLRDYVATDGTQWRARASACSHRKLHPLLLDAGVNAPRPVCANVFHAAALCVFKACTLFDRQCPRSPGHIAAAFADAALMKKDALHDSMVNALCYR